MSRSRSRSILAASSVVVIIITIVVLAVSLLTDKVSAFSPSLLCRPVVRRNAKANTPSSTTTTVFVKEPRGGGGSSSSSNNSNKNVFDIEYITQVISDFDVTDVIDNIKGDGNQPLGSRGEVYFVAQAVLLIMIAVGGVPFIGPPLQALGGPGLLLGGILIGVLAFVDLGSDSLSPFPDPTVDGDLKTQGIYSKIRHPMYTANIMISAGLSILTNSADRLL
jgi:Phospholipid methyltransferase